MTSAGCSKLLASWVAHFFLEGFPSGIRAGHGNGLFREIRCQVPDLDGFPAMGSVVVLSSWTIMVPNGPRSIGRLHYCHSIHDPGLLSSPGFPRSHSQCVVCMVSRSHHSSLCGIAVSAAEWGLLRTGPSSRGGSGGLVMGTSWADKMPYPQDL